ncbi:MAG TPA: 2-octaprenyl-6-methoxyphenyl hydroxylase [Gammaproteobacteria bacterium]|nr:2-octaprenyl-6-methoxyphenyl hydroxylase [Gammaproteobacteria bacterium]
MTLDCDICISGGGMVGGTLAWGLVKAGYSVALLEPQSYRPDAVPPLLNERSVALSYSSRVLLDALGLWSDIAGEASPIAQIHVSERGRFGATRLHAREERVEALGYVVRNSVFLQALYRKLSELPHLALVSGAKLSDITQHPDRVRVRAEQGGETLAGDARLLIACDGSQSSVPTMLGLQQSTKTYEQSAIIANLHCAKPHQGTAYERFTPSGPLAMLPLAPNTMAMVYTVASTDAPGLMALDDTQMLARVQRRFGYRLGHFEHIGARVEFPLALVQSSEQYRGRVLMMGNSARTLHPVSGQGFNLALRDSALLLEKLVSQGRDGDPGSVDVLRDFCQERQRDQRDVVRFTDTLVRVFRGRAPGFSHLRALGLSGLECLPPLKHRLARQSMGLGNRLPDLSQLTVP